MKPRLLRMRVEDYQVTVISRRSEPTCCIMEAINNVEELFEETLTSFLEEMKSYHSLLVVEKKMKKIPGSITLETVKELDRIRHEFNTLTETLTQTVGEEEGMERSNAHDEVSK